MPLPFRTSPSFKHNRPFSQTRRNTPKPLFTQTITPADSEEETSPPFAATSNAQLPAKVQQGFNETRAAMDQLDVEMDLGSPKQWQSPQQQDLHTTMISPKASPFSVLSPRTSKTDSSNNGSGGRLPTPIYGHFQQSVDTSMDEAPQQPQTPSPQDSEYERHMRARRLPTPISEDEAMDVFDGSTEGTTNLSLPRVRQPPTLAKRGKPMFSMGFRADCEMCRNRVPGHYNHIFRA